MNEVLRSRQSNVFFVELAKKLSPYSGQKVNPAVMMKLLNQACWEAKAPQYNCGQKDSSDAVKGFVVKLRKDLADLSLTPALTIGDGRGKGYSISVNVDAVIKALDNIDVESYLTELRKPGPKKTKVVKKPVVSTVKEEDRVDIPIQVPKIELKHVGKINLEEIPKNTKPVSSAQKTTEGKRAEREIREAKQRGQVAALAPNSEEKRRTRTMSDIRRIYGIAGVVRLFGGEIKLSSLYSILLYNTFYRYPNLIGFDKEMGQKNLRILLTSVMDDVFNVKRDEMNNLIVTFKREDSWSRIKNLYQGRIMTATFAVNDIGYTWEEDFISPFVKDIVKVDGKPVVVTLGWDMTIQSIQNLVLNCGDALDGAKLISYRVNKQEIIVEKVRCTKILNWIFEIDEYTRENGLLMNAVNIDASLGFDIISALRLGDSDTPAINNRLFYMMERL